MLIWGFDFDFDFSFGIEGFEPPKGLVLVPKIADCCSAFQFLVFSLADRALFAGIKGSRPPLAAHQQAELGQSE